MTFTAALHYGIPPAKNGDYAFLLHILTSLKSTGKGAIILPHGVLFRGGAEADIRKNIVRRGYIKGIIGLPANLFYGTGIPACIIVLDKENAAARKGIFMIDASKGFIKDGNKNRLRAQDIHKIVDAFTRQLEIAKYCAHGAAGRDRGQRLQPQHPALHRQQRAGRPAGHRRPPARRHPQPRHRRAGPLLAGLPQPCAPRCLRRRTGPATASSRWRPATSRPPSSAIPNSPPSINR